MASMTKASETQLETTPLPPKASYMSTDFVGNFAVSLPSFTTVKLDHPSKFHMALTQGLSPPPPAFTPQKPAPCKRGGHRLAVSQHILKKPSCSKPFDHVQRQQKSPLLGNMKLTLGSQKSYFVSDRTTPALIVEFSAARFGGHHSSLCVELFSLAAKKRMSREDCIRWRDSKLYGCGALVPADS